MLQVEPNFGMKDKIEELLSIALDEERYVVMVDISGDRLCAEPESVAFIDGTEIRFLDRHAERRGALLSNVVDAFLGEPFEAPTL